MKRSYLSVVLALVAGCIFEAGCASNSSETRDTKSSSGSRDTKGRVPMDSVSSKPIPADSPFAKIQKGMSMKEVIDLIGVPTDTATRLTGKQWNPFSFGHDVARSISLYKGMGRIYYRLSDGTLQVFGIDYDPDESGYASRK